MFGLNPGMRRLSNWYFPNTKILGWSFLLFSTTITFVFCSLTSKPTAITSLFNSEKASLTAFSNLPVVTISSAYPWIWMLSLMNVTLSCTLFLFSYPVNRNGATGWTTSLSRLPDIWNSPSPSYRFLWVYVVFLGGSFYYLFRIGGTLPENISYSAKNYF